MNGETAVNDAARRGEILAIRGSVVDVRFSGPPPPRRNRLLAGPAPQVVLEVQTHLDKHTVRCIAMHATHRLGRGMPVQDTGATVKLK